MPAARFLFIASFFHSHHIFFRFFKVVFFQIDDPAGLVLSYNQTAAVDRDILFRNHKNRAVKGYESHHNRVNDQRHRKGDG